MKVLLYNTAISLYHQAIKAAALLGNKKAQWWLEGRKHWQAEVQKLRQQCKKAPILFHAASLGEYEQCRPLIQTIHRHHPTLPIVVSFFSPSGFQFHKPEKGVIGSFYLPLDTVKNMKTFLHLLQPRLILIAKYELWYHLIDQAYSHRIPTIVFSARLLPYHKHLRLWYQPLMQKLYHIFFQDKTSLALYKKHFAQNNASFAGDTRFDTVLQNVHHPWKDPIIEQFIQRHHVLIAGSTWEKDIVLLSQLHLPPTWKLIIAPHSIEKPQIAWIQKHFPNSLFYSEVQERSNLLQERSVLVIDHIGFLKYLYRYATLAYIGGGFQKGIHNVLEAVVYGVPVAFGPRFHTFPEAVELQKEGFATVVKNVKTLQKWLKPPDERLKKQLQQWIQSHSGATKTIYNFLQQRQLL